MVDVEHRDHAGTLVDLVHDSVCAASGGPQPCQLTLQRMTHTAGVLAQRSDHELDHSRTDTRAQARELPLSRRRDTQFTVVVGHDRR